MNRPLPSAVDLFATYLQPWYPSDHPGGELRSDLEEIELPEGVHIRELQVLDAEGQKQTRDQIDRISQAALQDLASICEVSSPLQTNQLAELESAFSNERVYAILEGSQPEDLSNNWLVLCCELGAYLGLCLQEKHPQLQWLCDWPYWDSSLFDLNSKCRIPVFHWAFKFMSADEPRSLSDKINGVAEFLQKPGP